MVEVVAALVGVAGLMSVIWGFVFLCAGLSVGWRAPIILGSLMILVPFVGGCIYVGVVL